MAAGCAESPLRSPGIGEQAAGPWMIATLRVLLRRMQAMITRWLGSVSLWLSVLAGVVAADDGWRPAGSQPRAITSSATTAASGALGVTLGRPMPMDDSPESNATGLGT